jgi:hypothetical protein
VSYRCRHDLRQRRAALGRAVALAGWLAMALLLHPAVTLAAQPGISVATDLPDIGAVGPTVAGGDRSGQTVPGHPATEPPTPPSWTSTPLGVWALASLGGVCLLLLVVAWPVRDDDIPAGPFRMALSRTETAPPAEHRGRWPRRHRSERVGPVVASEATPELPPTAARTFDHPPARGVERFTIGYQRVRLSAGADDLRSPELGRLERGDEVELVGSFEGYIQVRTPSGAIGWIHRNTIV